MLRPSAPLANEIPMPRLTIDPATTIHVHIAGEGPAVVLLHCSAGSGAAWLRIMEVLKRRYLAFAPDLLGYGATTGWPMEAPLRLAHELRLIAAVTEHAGEPVHLVGHSYGGSLALSAARRLPGRIASLTLIEPVAFQILRLAGDPHWAEIRALGERHVALAGAGRHAEAAHAFIDYWMGDGTWAAMPAPRRGEIIGTMPKVAAEWGLAFTSDEAVEQFADLAMPTLMICGGRTRAPARRALDLLRATLPGAAYLELADAGHMSPMTHGPAVAQALLAHFAARDARAAA
jgi:pimeloyl-ACP methyl ester carboxylesterase